ncbi:MAG: hypothetical protein SPK72_05275 [Bacteroidales bacterium]|jgi:disulfide bond formation protein DsbB|nr:hypothetical protein [Bacteroidales bacterium]
MAVTIAYVVGVILGVVAVLEILSQPINTFSKIIISILVVITSWVGIAVYYLLLRGNLTKYFR